MKSIYPILVSLMMITSTATFANSSASDGVKQSSIASTAININTATAMQLSTLKGIGMKKAQAIISYRETHGGFTHINDLQKVKGIGEKFIEKNQKHLTL